MSVGYIYNGYGRYETNNGEYGITMRFAGLRFWLPFEKVTAIPRYTLRELDHFKSTPERGQVQQNVYQNTIVEGDAIVRQLCQTGVPFTAEQMGVIPIEGKSTGRLITVNAGCSADGQPLTTDIQEREATESEKRKAAKAAHRYKEEMVSRYFQGKRVRMMGGGGFPATPDDRIRDYMDELGVEDLDDVTAHAKQGGFNPQLIQQLGETIAKASSEAVTNNLLNGVKTVRNSEKAQLAPRKEKNIQTVAPLSEEEKERRRLIGQRLKEARLKKQQPQMEPVSQ